MQCYPDDWHGWTKSEMRDADAKECNQYKDVMTGNIEKSPLQIWDFKERTFSGENENFAYELIKNKENTKNQNRLFCDFDT